MKKVKYNGTLPALMPTLGIEVQPGDIIEVPDDFVNALFEEVPPDKGKGNEAKDGKQGSDK